MVEECGGGEVEEEASGGEWVRDGGWVMVYGGGGGGAPIQVGACTVEYVVCACVYYLRRAGVDNTKVRKPIE